MIFYGGKPAGAYRMRPYAAGGDACIDPEGFRRRQFTISKYYNKENCFLKSGVLELVR